MASSERQTRERKAERGKHTHSRRVSRGGVKGERRVPCFNEKRDSPDLSAGRQRAYNYSKTMPVAGERKDELRKKYQQGKTVSKLTPPVQGVARKLLHLPILADAAVLANFCCILQISVLISC